MIRVAYAWIVPVAAAAIIIMACSMVKAQDNKFCRPYSCPKDYEPVPKWPLQLTSSGCSSMGGMQVFGGITDEKDPMRPCCDIRHACLQTCGSVKTICDEEYVQCGKDVCVAMTDEEEKSKCEKSASINDIMVKMDGCQRFDQLQSKHCECVPKDKVQTKRERVIRAFYKKFNPENVDKVSGLIQKVDTTAKMVGLLLKLYKKYPAVITRVKDPKQEMMEKMMKESREREEDEDESPPSAKPTTTTTTNAEAGSGADNNGGTEDLGVDEL